jgi:hypothetical protein
MWRWRGTWIAANWRSQFAQIISDVEGNFLEGELVYTSKTTRGVGG